MTDQGEPIIIQNPGFEFHFENRNVAYANGMHVLYHAEKQCDMAFIVEGKKIPAHRHIIAFTSSKFEQLFESIPTCDSIEVQWDGGAYEFAKYMLQYIYDGSVKIRKTDLNGFVAAAKFMDLKTDLQDLNLPAIMEGRGDYVDIMYNGWGEEITKGFQKLYAEQKFFDMTIQIDGKELKAHRHALSACSSFFEAMCSVTNVHQTLELILNADENLTYESVRDTLNYIYMGEVKVDDLMPFLNTGEFLEVSGLKRAENLLAKRPSKKDESTFHVYANADDDVRNDNLVKSDENVTTVTVTQKEAKPRRIEVSDNSDDSDDDKQGYSPSESIDSASESGSEEEYVPHRKPTKPVVALPKKMMRTRTQKVGAKQSQMQRKSVAVPQKVNKARGNRKQSMASNKVKQRNDSKKNTGKLNLTQEEIDLVLALRQQRTRGQMAFNEEDENEKAIDRDYVCSGKEDISAFEDQNNNEYLGGEHDTELMSQSYADENDNQYDYDSGAVGGYEVPSEDFYIEDLTEDSRHSGQQTNVRGNMNYAPEIEEYTRKYTPKQQPLGLKKFIPKNGAPKNDEGFNVVANFTTTPKGARALFDRGFFYTFFRKYSNCENFRCNFYTPRPEHKYCSAFAYAKKINGVIMVSYPSDNVHIHAPKY